MEIMTKLVQCSCGNYYNAANHTSCPICGAAGSNQTMDGGDHSFGPTVAPGAAASAPTGGNFGPTVAPGAAASVPTGGNFGPTVAPGMNNAKAGGVDMTRPVFTDNKAGGNMNAAFSPTETIYASDKGGSAIEANAVQPVVGWLVCIEGAMRGNDYRIHAGYNSIGREIGDIHIRGDQTISRQNHARIAFEPKSSRFFFSPADGRNIVYVNDEMVMMTAELHAFDILTIGESKLMFVPLCGERFSWNG